MNRFIAVEVCALFLVCIAGLVCCHTSSTPPEPPSVIVSSDAADASAAVQSACQKLSTYCAVEAGTCVASMTVMLADPLHPTLDFACIAAHADKPGLQGCAGIGVQGCP